MKTFTEVFRLGKVSKIDAVARSAKLALTDAERAFHIILETGALDDKKYAKLKALVKQSRGEAKRALNLLDRQMKDKV